MRQAFFITGFNNWGKSTIIKDLFSGRSRFYRGVTYPMIGMGTPPEFTVQSQSNDDLGCDGWVDRILEKLDVAPDGGENLLSAMCPSLEHRNNFIDFLTRPPFDSYDKLHIFLLEYKWELHARLMIENIMAAGGAIPNVNLLLLMRMLNWEIRLTGILPRLNK